MKDFSFCRPVLPKQDLPFVSVVVPTRDRAAILKDCLEGLLVQDYPRDRYEIVVIDDGSEDDTAQVVAQFRQRCADLRVSYLYQHQAGMVPARIRGVIESVGELIAFIDDDATPETSWMTALVNVALLNECGIVGGPVKSAPAKVVTATIDEYGRLIWNGFDVRPFDNAVPVDFVPGGNFAVWKSVLGRAGGFDRRFDGTAWREETDLCVRVRKLGLKILLSRDAVVYHKSVRWTSFWQLRPSTQYSLAKNNGYFVGKHFLSAKTVVYWLVVEPASWFWQQLVRTAALTFVFPVRWFGALVGLVKGFGARSAHMASPK